MNSIAVTFDAAAADYAQQLDQGISLSGESAEFFVNGRAAWLANYMRKRAIKRADAITSSPPTVLDFGCGVGNACKILHERLNAHEVIGLDCSVESLRVAATRHPLPAFKWTVDGADIAAASVDIAYTSGVFHHIEPELRQAELAKLFGWLKPGGVLALFENNPWNPGTRWVMSRIAFDRDAKCLSPVEAQRRVSHAGFDVLQMRSLFYFPKLLSWLRPIEAWLSPAPLGAQYVVLAQRPR